MVRIVTGGPVKNAPQVGAACGSALTLTIVIAEMQTVEEGGRRLWRFCLVALPGRDHITQPANLNRPKQDVGCMRSESCTIRRHVLIAVLLRRSVDSHFRLALIAQLAGDLWLVPNCEILVLELCSILQELFFATRFPPSPPPHHSESRKPWHVFAVRTALAWWNVAAPMWSVCLNHGFFLACLSRWFPVDQQFSSFCSLATSYQLD